MKETTNPLTPKFLYPNPLGRLGFKLGTARVAVGSLMQAKDEAIALRHMYEKLAGCDPREIDTYLNDYSASRRDEIFHDRQSQRYTARCEEVVDKAIGSLATQQMALRFIGDIEV